MIKILFLKLDKATQSYFRMRRWSITHNKRGQLGSFLPSNRRGLRREGA